MRTRSIFLISMCATLVPALHAQGVSFPVLAIGEGQAARLSVLNLAATNPKSPTTCAVELQFLDSHGKQATQTSLQISPGQAASLELKRSDLPPEAGRIDFRAIVIFGATGGANPPTTQSSDCGNLFPSLELYDSITGRTTLLVTGTKDLPASGIVPQ